MARKRNYLQKQRLLTAQPETDIYTSSSIAQDHSRMWSRKSTEWKEGVEYRKASSSRHIKAIALLNSHQLGLITCTGTGLRVSYHPAGKSSGSPAFPRGSITVNECLPREREGEMSHTADTPLLASLFSYNNSRLPMLQKTAPWVGLLSSC